MEPLLIRPLRALGTLVLASVVACSTPAVESPPPSTATDVPVPASSSRVPTRAAPVLSPVPIESASPAASSPDTEVVEDLPQGRAREPGAACSTGAHCRSGVCEGMGCGPDEGRCAAAKRMCTRDLRAYCGCDGVTFHNSGSCPGARYAHPGLCPKDVPAKR
ncbi:MAG: hypothetical protein VB934_12975 [Polyangiaceae bacterium]